MCGRIQEELGAVVGVIEGGEGENLNDEVFVDAIEGGEVGGAEDVGGNVGVLDVGGADANISVNDGNGGEEVIGGAEMDTNEVGDIDNTYITVEEVVRDNVEIPLDLKQGGEEKEFKGAGQQG